jgi:hypothetical protein
LFSSFEKKFLFTPKNETHYHQTQKSLHRTQEEGTQGQKEIKLSSFDFFIFYLFVWETNMTTKKSSSKSGKRGLNEFMRKSHAARKSGADSFEYKGKTYKRKELIYFQAKK